MDQLALWAAPEQGAGVANGVARAFRSDVRFVLINGVEVGPATYRTWALVHLATSVLLVVPFALLFRRRPRTGQGSWL